MADHGQFEVAKAKASTLFSQAWETDDNEKAVSQCIAAADCLMKALRLKTSSEQRAETMAQVKLIVNYAESRKKTTPIVHLAPDVAELQSEVPVSEALHPEQGKEVILDGPNPNQPSSMDRDLNHLSISSATDSSGSRVTTELKTKTIRTLPEPVTTRKLTTKEKILILKSSKFNGFKFPLWSPLSQADFELDDAGLPFSDSRELVLSPHQLKFFDKWTRAQDALPPPGISRTEGQEPSPVMVSDRPIDLVQDAGTDCSVVASLCAAISRTDRGYEELLTNKIWPNDEQQNVPVISKNGKYIVRLNFNGDWRRVIIDDRLPVSQTSRLLHVLDRSNPALLWPALLEKAYLKVRGGYDFPGSNSCSDLWAMTGWIPEQIYLQQNDIDPQDLWKRIFRAFQYGDVLITLGTGKMSRRNERDVGLEGQHSYAILDLREEDDEKLFLIKNPWVAGKRWRGIDSTGASGSDNKSPPTNPDIKPSVAPAQSMTFWKPFQYVIRHFESLYLNWNPGLFLRREDIHFEWVIRTSKGQEACIVDHPQFSLKARSSGTVWLLLSRHFRGGGDNQHEDSDAFNDGSIRVGGEHSSNEDSPKGYACITVYNAGGERIFMKDGCLEGSPFVDTPQALLRWECEAQKDYTIVIDQEDLPPSDYTFTLSAFANSAITFSPATDKYVMATSVSGAWIQESAGGDTTSPRYFDNPQYALRVPEKMSLVVMISSQGHEHPLHVKLAYGGGKRMFSLNSRDIIAASGEYRRRCTVAQVDGLGPGAYTILCSLFEAGKTGDFSLRVHSTKAVQLAPIPREGAGLFSKKLQAAWIGPQMHKVAIPIQLHRLARYTFIARLVQVTGQQLKARSPVRLSVEHGKGPSRETLACSGNGEYALSTVVRCEALDLDPQAAKGWNMYVVIDRLTGPGGPIEEWYEVEVLADIPNAFQTGVWQDWDD